MTMENGNARFHRRSNSTLSAPEATKKSPKILPVLLSCCLFFIILCACLIAVLVLVGRHLYESRNDGITVTVSPITNNDSIISHKQKQLLTRLPNSTIPIHYDIVIAPNLTRGHYTGSANITLNVLSSSTRLVLHNKNLNLTNVQLFSCNESKVIDVEHAVSAEYLASEMALISPRKNAQLLPGLYFLNIEFEGSLLDKNVGLYRSRYKINDTEWRSIVTSKFEPTYARQAFPCFDEPNMKAKFTVHLLKPKDDSSYIALSNMPEVSQEVQENGIMVHFQESVKMSTYLTCFIVCDFNYTKNTIVTPGYPDVKLRVYATPAQLEKTKFAAEVAVGVIQYFNKYFNIPYPLPKLDLIAIPDFVSGAMEHWGLVTFRETSLLYDEHLSSVENKQRVASVISHELAHSWFGNLVTMDWWNDLWLNEGFASYIEYKGVDSVYPEWQMMDQFLTNKLHPILARDSTPASHPIVQTVETPDQITEIFDSITYSKGASVLRMLEGTVGETIFQNAITNYLNAYQYSNAVTQNLWDELQKLIGKKSDVTEFMNTWTVQMGYPILTVTEDGNGYVLTQKRFLQDEDDPGVIKSPYDYKWTIPVTYVTDLNSTPELIWFDHTKSLVNIPKPQGAKWIKFNYKQIGYYRVNYDSNHWHLLAENIKHLSVADRVHLLEEAFSIAESGQLDYSVPLNLTKYLKDEMNYVSWSVAASKLTKLKKYLVNSLEYGKFLSYIEQIVDPVYRKVTWNDSSEDGHLERHLRILILGLACSVKHPDAVKEASNRFKNWLNDPVQYPLSQSLRPIVLKYGMVQSGKNEWERLLTLYKNEIDSNEKMNLLSGLTAVREPWLLQRLMELAKDDQVVRRQDYVSMMQHLAANPVGAPVVWDYVRENWNQIVDRFTLNDRTLGQLMPAITNSFLTKTKLKEIERFFKEYPEAGAGKYGREQALTNVRNNIKWVAKNKKTLEDWILNNSSNS